MNKALYEKLFSEQEKYRAWLLEQPPAKILNHAYEYSVREDIILTLEYHDVDDDQARVLLAQENLLGELFDAFEHRETNYMDVVSSTVYDLANTLLSEEEREKNKLRDLPIYYHSGEYARENGELDKYRESRAANIGCRDAITITMTTVSILPPSPRSWTNTITIACSMCWPILSGRRIGTGASPRAIKTGLPLCIFQRTRTASTEIATAPSAWRLILRW